MSFLQHQWGKILGALIIVVIIVLGFFLFMKSDEVKSDNLANSPAASEEKKEAEVEEEDTTPKIQHIGIDFDVYDTQTNRAGDFEFTQKPFRFNRPWLDYGFTIPASSASAEKENPQATFILPLGTSVRSLIDGVVVDVPQLDSGDYSVMVAKDMESEWVFETEHVINPVVKKGDKVKAGQVVAEVSDFDAKNSSGYGLVEIGILQGGNPPSHLCPFLYLDPSIKTEIHQKILDLYRSWETYRNDPNLYGEDQYDIPGCLTLEAIAG